jgi:hypothetical protein
MNSLGDIALLHWFYDVRQKSRNIVGGPVPRTPWAFSSGTGRSTSVRLTPELFSVALRRTPSRVVTPRQSPYFY